MPADITTPIQEETAQITTGIQVPEDVDVSALFGHFFALAAPCAGIAFIIACAVLISKIIKRAEP